MRISGRALLTACTLTLAIGCLTACTPTHTAAQPSSKPTPTPTPIFTSDAEALAAATAVYKKFLSTSDEVGHDGGADPERVSQYVNAAVLDAERLQAKKLADAHARSYGDTKVSNSILQSINQRGSSVTVTIYACEDLSDVDVRDSSGKSLISKSRADHVAYVVEVGGTSTTALLVTSNKFWGGGGVCDS